MAKVKRANHRSGTERPQWTPSGTVDEPGVDDGDWDTDELRSRDAAGSNGHSDPSDQVDPPVRPAPGQKVQNGHARLDRPGDDDVADQNSGAQGAVGFGTPVRVDEIALAAMALSEDLEEATRGLPESIESRRFRRDLDDAAGAFRSVAGELETTAGNLIRLAANEGRTCGVTWGVCPEHGLSLVTVGEVLMCRVLGCYREPEGTVERCTQPVTYRVVDAAGPALLTCAGHAIACRLHLEGAVITLASDSLEVL